jgi:hypothetical protein
LIDYIALSVLQFAASEYSFGIFKLVFSSSYADGNQGTGVEQAHKCGRVKPV